MKRLRISEKMRELMTGYYMAGMQAECNAWITSGAPVELLHALDIYPVYPENHGALIGATKLGGYYCEFAEKNGFSRDLCSYARCDIGCVFAGTSPIGGLPKPTFLFACNNICNTVVKWYEVLSRIFKVPLFVLDMPFIRKELKDSHLRYVEEQLYDFISFAERVTDRKLDDAKLRDVVLKSMESVELYSECLRTAANKPSPMTCFDAFVNMAPIVCLRGTDHAVSFYKEMKQELDERVKEGVSAIEREEIRLLWDNIPVWYRLKWFGEFFEKRNACLVADTYTNAWSGFKVSRGEDVLSGMAEVYTVSYLNIGMEMTAEIINKLIDLYDVDGVVMHSNRSCKPYSFGQYEIQKKLSVPSVIIEADMVDERVFSEAQVVTRLEAFLEML
ncbi:MAG: 2-hydroxyacyl-CoA dehydratase subunit D [Archaeoglobales archaeon]|jgi:benzoyl-CoA reductase/2-hydroxyglutaryl-CoA dehydratase subunit BcrC/BadD/HgdB|nr:2-hydroxyacyl-CoA dehydratase subunit D [Archaeoglobales archaeon]